MNSKVPYEVPKIVFRVETKTRMVPTLKYRTEQRTGEVTVYDYRTETKTKSFKVTKFRQETRERQVPVQSLRKEEDRTKTRPSHSVRGRREDQNVFLTSWKFPEEQTRMVKQRYLKKVPYQVEEEFTVTIADDTKYETITEEYVVRVPKTCHRNVHCRDARDGVQGNQRNGILREANRSRG